MKEEGPMTKNDSDERNDDIPPLRPHSHTNAERSSLNEKGKTNIGHTFEERD
jgi:hypothetical protein